MSLVYMLLLSASCPYDAPNSGRQYISNPFLSSSDSFLLLMDFLVQHWCEGFFLTSVAFFFPGWLSSPGVPLFFEGETKSRWMWGRGWVGWREWKLCLECFIHEKNLFFIKRKETYTKSQNLLRCNITK